MSNPQANQSNKASPKVPTKAVPDPQPSTTVSPATGIDLPTFANIREVLKGQEVTLFVPSNHWFATIYCEVKRDEAYTRFGCKLLDVVIDEETGTPLNALIQYRDRGARIWGSRDLINLDGITISTSYLLPIVKDDEDDDAPESVTKH